MYTGIDQPGGVFLRQADQIPEEELTLFIAACARGAGGRPRLAGPAVRRSAEVPELPEFLAQDARPADPSAPLPFMELPYFNGLGGFTPDGREYAIYLGPGTRTPAPWVNVMANPRSGRSSANRAPATPGAATASATASPTGRTIRWWTRPPTRSTSATRRPAGSGLPPACPIRELDAYRARHGAGYTVFEHNSHAIEQELTVFVPMDDDGGDPVRLQRLRLKNDSSRRRRLSVTFYVEWTLGETPGDDPDAHRHPLGRRSGP